MAMRLSALNRAAAAGLPRRGPDAIIYGTAWKKSETKALVRLAVEQGFRSFDTANMPKHYDEQFVGDAFKDLLATSSSGLQRSDVWVQTKFTPNACHEQPPERHPYDPEAPVEQQVRQSLQSSLDHLGTTYLDSFLLHAPLPSAALTLDAWREIERIHDEGLARHIGVSNFHVGALEWLLGNARLRPSFVQNRCLNEDGWDRDVREMCTQAGLRYQGFWLLTGNGHVVHDSRVVEVARRHRRTPEQVLFRFVIQALDVLPLSGTRDAEHMRQDLAAARGDFELTQEEVQQISKVAPTWWRR